MIFSLSDMIRTIHLSAFIRSLLATKNGPSDTSPIVISSLTDKSPEPPTGKQSSKTCTEKISD
ncbi:unnamed protein product [Oikopleura dioica]|uniref:Uncharacterized protein n=1 Tax=Oikopleura dioica TaxID=34765 RepID=E4XQM7_OIKDI|nr:unnamed protein product [Oikopleura dioica]